MNTIIVHAASRLSNTFDAVFEALHVSPDCKPENSQADSPYDTEFVYTVLDLSEKAERGNVVADTPELKRQWLGN